MINITLRNAALRASPRMYAWAAMAVATIAMSAPVFAAPDIWDYMIPSSVTRLVATGRTRTADQKELAVIGKDFGDAYRLKEASYLFIAPDRLEYSAAVGPTRVTYISTNTQRIIHAVIGPIKKDVVTDITGDITKRKTLFDLGLLPKNYLETVRVEYDGEDTAIGLKCESFTFRYLTDPPNCPRRFKVWIDPDKHYVVQKIVWNLDNDQHETVIYRNPEIVSGTHIFMPTWAEVWNQHGKFAGSVEYVKISGEQAS